MSLSTAFRTGTSRTVIVQRASTAPLALESLRRTDALLARLFAWTLDSRLAAGAAPESGRLLAARAAQLVDPRQREALAHGWDGVITRASEPSTAFGPRVPMARGAVLAAEGEIIALATALRATSPVAARDVARAHALLTDGTGPVYRRGRGLRTAVAGLVDDLAAACPIS